MEYLSSRFIDIWQVESRVSAISILPINGSICSNIAYRSLLHNSHIGMKLSVAIYVDTVQ